MINYENYDISFPDQPVIDHYLPVWASLPSFRSKPAFIWYDDKQTSRVLTYSQLNNSVQSISSQLLLRLRRRDTVLVLCQPGLELVQLIFSCQRSGLVSVPMFPPNPSFLDLTAYHHLARVVSQTKPTAAIAHPHYVAAVRSYITSSKNSKLATLLDKLHWISTSDINNISSPARLQNDIAAHSCGPDEVYLIQYTSGATGLPKPVQLTAGSAVHNVRVARKAYDLHPNSVIASWLPQYHDCGLQFLLLTIVSGATCVLTSPFAFLARPRIWLEMISRFNATCSPIPSFTLPLVLKRGGVGVLKSDDDSINLSSMRNLILINEPIYKSEVDEFLDVFEKLGLNRSSISPSYGLAENCTFVSTAWRDRKEGINNTNFEFPAYKKLLPSAVLPSEDEDDDEEMEIVVVNEETHDAVGDGIEGEIWVSSPSNCSGYLEHPSLSREICQARLKNKISKLCFLRTGDRGVVGRCSDVMKLADGREIHPHYLETAAQRSCPEFIRGGCLAAFKVENDVVLVAEMQGVGEKESVMKEICERIRKRVLEEEDVGVGKVVLVKSGSVPKTTSGKIRRWAAKDKLIAQKMRVLTEMKFDGKIAEEEAEEKAEANRNWIAFWSSKSADYQNRDSSMLRSQL
ncbi:Long-chain-fatty-acid--AMP ligase FadD32 [Linum grandiflorum]